MTRRIHCFVGPTISELEVKQVLPDARVHPPIAHGDLLRLSPSRGDVVAIIDGYFYERAPIRHKEILGCIEAGVTVAGAASMGALRASELHHHGMHGVGTVFRMYRRGAIEADDEVAVLHASGEHHFACMTEALVNIRASCARARRVRAVTPGDAQIVVSAASRMPFHRRSWPEVEHAMTRALGAHRAADVRRWCEGSRVDLKRRDARRMLEWLQFEHDATAVGTGGAPGPCPRTRFVEEWPHWEVDREQTDNGPIRDIHILSLAQALLPDYPSRHLRVMLECYVAASIDAGTHPSLDVRAVSIEDLEAAAWTIAQEAGTFPGGRIPAEVERHWLAAEEREVLGTAARAGRIIARSHRASGTLPLRAAAIRDVKLTYDVPALVAAVAGAWNYNSMLRIRDSHHDAEQLSPKPVQEFYLERWGRAGEPIVATTERGFVDLEDLHRRAGPFMLAARFGNLEVPAA